MTRLALVLLVVACHHDAAVPNAPFLPGDKPPAEPPSQSTIDTSPSAHLPNDPALALDPTIGAPPAANPTGQPIAITVVAPVVGDRRHREERDLFLVDNLLQGGEHAKQRTETTFDLDEEVLAVAGGAITRIGVSANAAHESLRMGTDEHPSGQELDLLAGSYVVGAAQPDDGRFRGHGGLPVTRAGSIVVGREEEELSGVYGGELGQPDRVVAFAATHPLRLGEVVELTAADKTQLVGEATPAPVHVAVVAADTTTVAYQVDITTVTEARYRDGEQTIRVRMRTVVERATGRIRERTTTTLRIEPSQASVSQHATRLGYR